MLQTTSIEELFPGNKSMFVTQKWMLVAEFWNLKFDIFSIIVKTQLEIDTEILMNVYCYRIRRERIILKYSSENRF